jgi:hypothetical protein
LFAGLTAHLEERAELRWDEAVAAIVEGKEPSDGDTED